MKIYNYIGLKYSKIIIKSKWFLLDIEEFNLSSFLAGGLIL